MVHQLKMLFMQPPRISAGSLPGSQAIREDSTSFLNGRQLKRSSPQATLSLRGRAHPRMDNQQSEEQLEGPRSLQSFWKVFGSRDLGSDH